MIDPQRFTTKIWTYHHVEQQAYAFLSHKDWDTGQWKEFPGEYLGNGLWPDEVDELEERDIYFAPLLFSRNRRLKQYALPSRILYADLDEVTPESIDTTLTPTLAWETSPGRFQALWLLDRPLAIDRFETLNKRMTYGVGADKGGWSATKVLRVPGTVSTKYGRSRAKRFAVALCGSRGPRYKVEDLTRLLPKAEKAGRVGGVFKGVDVARLPNRKEVLAEWRPRLPGRARKLIGTRHAVVGDDRSARLWELYNLLLQAGMSPEEVLVVTQGTVWNKYAGQRRELAQLQIEISKAAQKHAQPDELERLRRTGGKKKGPRGAVARKVEKEQKQNGHKLGFVRLEDFMRMQFPQPAWLVEGIWSEGAHGIWAGEYKSYKTVTLLDFALSVTSGQPFLGRFNVHQTGSVGYLHEEGRQGLIQDRMHRIMMNKGLAAKVTQHSTSGAGSAILEAPADLPLYVSSFPNFRLTDKKSQRGLVEWVGDTKPVAVILETWYLIAGEINENSAEQVAPVLAWLSQVGQDFGCAIILSHHYNKSADEQGHQRRAAQRVSGTGVFGRWYESAVFIERRGEEDDYRARLEAQHREQKGTGKTELQFDMDTEDENDYKVEFIDKDGTTAKIHDVAENTIIPMTKRRG